MKIKSIHTFVLSSVVVLLLIISGCATTPAENTSAPQPSEAPGSASPPISTGTVQEVPRLKILIACGSCSIPDTVPILITEGYANAAAKSGVPVSSTAEATLSITSYTQRHPANRALFGAFAGKDEIKAVVAYKGTKFEVEDYYRNAWLGMNALSRGIGEQTFEKIK